MSIKVTAIQLREINSVVTNLEGSTKSLKYIQVGPIPIRNLNGVRIATVSKAPDEGVVVEFE